MGKVLGDKLLYARLEEGKSRLEIAKQAGISVSHLYRIEEGEREASQAAVVQLANALGRNPADFLEALSSDKGFGMTGKDDTASEDLRREPELRKAISEHLSGLGRPDLHRILELLETYYPKA